MNEDHAANALAALGNPVRLQMYRTLVRAGRSGLNISDLQTHLEDVPRSTLNHHLGKLTQAGLVEQHKDGSSVFNYASFSTMDTLVTYLTDECCRDEAEVACRQGEVLARE